MYDIGVIENCQNPDSFGEICVKCNKCGRFDREKQIEEMVKVIASVPPIDFPVGGRMQGKHIYTLNKFAETLYNAGYRKQSEGEFTLFKPRRENRNATYKCSVCGKACSSYYNDVGQWKYCPHCGTKMKGGVK